MVLLPLPLLLLLLEQVRMLVPESVRVLRLDSVGLPRLGSLLQLLSSLQEPLHSLLRPLTSQSLPYLWPCCFLVAAAPLVTPLPPHHLSSLPPLPQQ